MGCFAFQLNSYPPSISLRKTNVLPASSQGAVQCESKVEIELQPQLRLAEQLVCDMQIDNF
jgi:hypothetical protein